jgi:hypothetical protein
MPIKITDWHIAWVRAFVSQDAEQLKPMLGQMPHTCEPDGTSVMLRAAFVQAVSRRFGGQTRADIVRFVAHARIRRGRNAPPIDPAVAEKLIMAVLTGTPTEGLTNLQQAQHIILLSELIEDENPTDAELDRIMAEARTFAERIAATV